MRLLGQQYSVRRSIIKMEQRTAKATSYKDLLQHFQQADKPIDPPTHKPPTPRPLHLKKHPQPQHTPRQNKQNLISKPHLQSLHQKSISNKSEWVQQDVLKQYSQKRKERQTELSYNKFIAYITHILCVLTGATPPDLLTNRLTYLQYLAALKQMLFIKETYEPAPQDSVAQLWAQLASHGQTVGAFILFIATILNFRKSQDENAGKFAYLSKKYADLRFTRMEMQGKVKTLQDQDQHPYTPSISQRSRTLAASRSKSKGRTDRCLAQKSYHQLLEQSVQVPPDSSQIRCQSPSLDQFLGNRRSQILYKLAKQKSLQKRRDKKSNQVQYQKSIKELTFHPKIHQPAHHKQSKKNIQGQQDSIDRMIRGRIEREVRKIIQEKGLPYNEKMFQRMKKEKYEALQKQRQNQHMASHHQDSHQQLPPERLEPNPPIQQPTKTQDINKSKKEPIVLLIQVDEGHCQKLIIEDVAKYKEAAAKFIKDFNLKPEMYDKLVDGVQSALKFQLTPINEAPYQSQYESID